MNTEKNPNDGYNYSEKAKEYFLNGYNCAQAVLLSFAHRLNISEEEIIKLSSSLGGGMGGLREVCGALSAGFVTLGLLHGYTDPTDQEAKTKHYERIQALASRFEEMFGSIICRDLLESIPYSLTPSERTKEYYLTRPCTKLVEVGARLLEELIADIESGKL